MRVENRKNKTGISLILLMLMIVVMIIISGAIIFTSMKNNPTGNAKNAKYAHDRTEVQSAISVVLGKIMTDKGGEVTVLPQGDISSGIEYRVTNQKEGTTYGKIGWKTPVTEAPSGYDTTYTVGMSLPTFSGTDYRWKIGTEGNVTLRVGDIVYDKNNGEGRELKAVVVCNRTSSSKQSSDSGVAIDILKNYYPIVDCKFDATAQEIIEGNYDLVVANGNYWLITNPELLNELFHAGMHVYSIGNDCTSNLEIIRTHYAKSTYELLANKKVNNYLTEKLPTTITAQDNGGMSIIIPNDKAISLYTFLDNGTEYTAMAYMENDNGGKWLHSQTDLMENVYENSIMQLKDIDFHPIS